MRPLQRCTVTSFRAPAVRREQAEPGAFRQGYFGLAVSCVPVAMRLHRRVGESMRREAMYLSLTAAHPLIALPRNPRIPLGE